MPKAHPVLTLSLPTPIGRLHMAATDREVIRIELPHANAEMRLKIWVALHFPHASIRSGVSPILKKAATQLERYFTGGLEMFQIPHRMVGTPFQVRVWEQSSTIPFGETRTYAQVAAAIDSPRATRAVGSAEMANPLPILVPCHRVIGSDGGLKGYSGGIDLKRWLLEHEGDLPERSASRSGQRLHIVAPLSNDSRSARQRPRSNPRH